MNLKVNCLSLADAFAAIAVSMEYGGEVPIGVWFFVVMKQKDSYSGSVVGRAQDSLVAIGVIETDDPSANAILAEIRNSPIGSKKLFLPKHCYIADVDGAECCIGYPQDPEIRILLEEKRDSV